MARIHIVGNSVAYGFSSDGSDWSTRLKAETNRRRHNGEKPRLTVTNLASPGNMLIHSLDSGLFEASVNCNRRGRQIGVLCVGICEASILRSQGQTTSRRSKADFRNDLEHLTAIVDKLNYSQPSECAVSIIFMGITPVNNEVSFSTPEGDDFNDEAILEYDDLIRDYAMNNDTQYVDLRSHFDTSTMLADDGIHPNQAGDDFIYRKIAPVILETIV